MRRVAIVVLCATLGACSASAAEPRPVPGERVTRPAAGERSFTLERDSGTVRFGDGVGGARPPAGQPASGGRTGGGAPGNVPGGATTTRPPCFYFASRC